MPTHELTLDGGNFESLHSKVFILADKYATSEYTLASGLIFKKHVEYLKYEHEFAVQSGIVKFLPKKTRCGNMELKIGDFVYCHHFLTTEPDNEISVDGELMYSMDYEEIYCVIRDEKIHMLKGWNFLDIIPNQEIKKSGLIVPQIEKYNQKVGYMAHPSEWAKEQGIELGDEVFLHKGAHYKVLVQGKLYYRVKDEYLTAFKKPTLKDSE